MARKQGDDIIITLKLYSDQAKTQPINIDNLTDVVTYVYTDGCKVHRFNKTGSAGYNKLKRISEYEYQAQLSSAMSRVLTVGPLMMALNVISADTSLTDGRNNLQSTVQLDVLESSPTKYE